MLKKLLEIIREQMATSKFDHLAHPEDAFALTLTDIGVDSLDAVEIQMAVEEAFDLEIQESEWEKVSTVGDLYHLIFNHKSGRQGATGADSRIQVQILRAKGSEKIKPAYQGAASFSVVEGGCGIYLDSGERLQLLDAKVLQVRTSYEEGFTLGLHISGLESCPELHGALVSQEVWIKVR